MSFTLRTLQEAIEAHPAKYAEVLAKYAVIHARATSLRDKKYELKRQLEEEEDPEKKAVLQEEWEIFLKEYNKADEEEDKIDDEKAVLDETFQCYRLLTEILTHKEGGHCQCREEHIHPEGTLRVRGQVDLAVHVPEDDETGE